MQQEAEAHAEEDKKRKEAIEIKNNADTLAYQFEKQLKELGDKVPDDKKKPVEDAIAKVREALKGSDTDAIKRTYEDLQNEVPGSQRRTLQAGRRQRRRQHPVPKPARTARSASQNRRPKVRRRTKAMSSTPNSKWSTKTRSNFLNTYTISPRSARPVETAAVEPATTNNQNTNNANHMAINVKPLGDRVLVEPLEEKEIKKGGIIIPDTAKEKPQEGVVVALGTGKIGRRRQESRVQRQEGRQRAHQQIRRHGNQVDGEDYLIMSEDDILGIID